MPRWTAPIRWHGPLRRWLGAGGSLSARLAALGTQFSVQVVRQGAQPLHRDEALALGLRRTELGYVREVVLRVDGVALVFARSATPVAAARGPWRAVRGLGTRPLAEVLFKRPVLARTPLEFARIGPSSALQHQVLAAWQQATGAPMARARALPARRSVWRRSGAPLLVMEVFTPTYSAWC